MKKSYAVSIIGGLIVLLALIGGLYFKDVGQVLGLSSTEFINYASDVMGTKSGTSTTPVTFYGNNTVASTTYVSKIGNHISQAIYTFQAVEASSTLGANAYFSFLGSNDDYCDTASTTTSLGAVTTEEINWFDIGDHLLNKVHSTSLPTGTSTLPWLNPTVGAGKVAILDNINYECLKLSVNASSTSLWAQIKTK